MIVRYLAKLFIYLLFVLSLSSCGPNTDHDPALWVLGEDGIARINSETGKPALFLPNTDEAKAFALDEPESRVWVLQKSRLQAWSFGGELQLDVPLGQIHHGNSNIAVDDARGLIWAGRNKELNQYDRQGVLKNSIEVTDNILALSIEPETGVVWVLTRHYLFRYAYDNALLTPDVIPIQKVRVHRKENREGKRGEKGKNDVEVYAIAWDPLQKSMWVASEDNLSLYGVDGVQLKLLQLRELHYLVPDGKGMLWVSDGKTLQYISADGQVQLSLDSHSATGSSTITALGSVRANDEHSRDVWVAGKHSISQVESGGGILRRFAEKHIRDLGRIQAISQYADIQSPVISIDSPKDNQFINNPLLFVSLIAADKGAGVDHGSLLLQLNNTELESECTWDGDKSSCTSLQPLSDGYYSLDASIDDYAGNKAKSEPVYFSIDTSVPNVVDVKLIHLQYKSDGTVNIDGDAGSAESNSKLKITNLRTGESIFVTVASDGSFSAVIASEPGDKLEIKVSDRAGNISPAIESIVPSINSLPTDPATVAPPLDPTRSITMMTATEFLYNGSNSIQRDVAPGTIEAKRVAVIRGRIVDNNGQALSGVHVSIQNHPEYGYTISRLDGMYDIVQNGGGITTINFAKEGYLSVQRKLELPWEEYTWSDDVVLTQLDSIATSIELGVNATQIARGSIVEDNDGQRQATLLIPPGTQADLVFHDGTSQPLTSATVRATEYTLGSNGPKAMPGELSTFSGYTYAVELSLDEAISASAKEVRFSQPIPFYIENFLHFPVGGIVPAGWYDRDKAAWMPSKNGRIIKILTINSGLAELDIDGSGKAADPATMGELGISQEERLRLATLYSPGKTLWRIPIEHFTPWDFNWPYGPPQDAVSPNLTIPDLADREDKPNCADGSIIECQNQAVGESILITGTPFSLNYRSDRLPGRTAAYTLKIPLIGNSIPAGLKRIELSVEIAGRKIAETFQAKPNQEYTYVWDGKDAYGRELYGKQDATVLIGYVYDAVYYNPSEFGNAFSSAGTGPITGNRTRNEIVMWQEIKRRIGLVVNMTKNGIGGWSIAPHHYYSNSEIWYGDGGKRSADATGATINKVTEGGSFAFSADGSIYDYGVNRIDKIDSNGMVTRIAGRGDVNIYCTYSGEGKPATGASFCPTRLIEDAFGNVYFTNWSKHSIHRVGIDGIITTIAGTGNPGFAGDGSLAKNAMLNGPSDIDIGDDGGLYFVDYNNKRIRRIGPDGVITTVAGNGESGGISGDGGPAVNAKLVQPNALAVASDGGLYILDEKRIRYVGVDGRITTIAGTSASQYRGDGGPATEASFDSPKDIALGPDGSIYVIDFSRYIRRIGPDGIVSRVVGDGLGYAGDGGPAIKALLNSPDNINFGPDGKLYISEDRVLNLDAGHRLRRVDTGLGGWDSGYIRLASEDGAEIYVFDTTGRHLSTLDSVTKNQRFQFGYTADGYLIEIRDAHGNLTEIERDSNGQPLAIIAPDGQRTTLALDANGFLSSINSPAGESWSMSYTKLGLLESFRNPKGNASKYSYDSLGRFVQNRNSLGGGWDVTRTDLVDGYVTSMTSAEGRITRYQVSNTPLGEKNHITTRPDGSIVKINLGKGEKRTVTAADGTLSENVLGADPRFGMAAPVTERKSITTPGQNKLVMTSRREAVLDDKSNSMSFSSLTEIQTVNNRTNTTIFTDVDKTWRSISPEGRNQLVTLDEKGKPILSKFADLSSTQYGYDSRGRLNTITLGDGGATRTITLSYDPMGNLELLTDPIGRRYQFKFDKAGRVTKQIEADGREILYSYDANGNLTGLTPPGRAAHVFEYDAVDNESGYHPPKLGEQPTPTFYRYNLDKELTEVIRPDGQNVKLEYSTSGKLSTLRLARGNYQYSYNGTTGKLTTVTSPDGSILNYSYDGFLPISTTWSGTISGTVSQSYDNNFWVTARKVNNQSFSYAYDNDGLLIQAGDMSLTRSISNGLLIGTGLGDIHTSHGYNSFGELVGGNATVGADNVAQFTYGRDISGRITSQSEVVAGESIANGYQYDQVGRLISVTRNNVTTNWGYDVNGNRTHVNGLQVAYYDEQDRLTSYNGTIYTYTTNGELKTKTTDGISTQFDYDELGNLLKVTLPGDVTIDYLIDGQNRRIGKKVNGKVVQGFLYKDQLNPVVELDGQGNVLSHFVYADKVNVPSYMIRAGKTYRIISDHLGSPRLVIDSVSGEIAQRMDYDVWGNVTKDSNPGFQPFGFAGGIYDQNTGLIRFGARDYDPEIGRWTSKDPIRFEGEDSNLFSYVLNNSVNFVDSQGQSPLEGRGTNSPGRTGNPISTVSGSGVPRSTGERMTNRVLSKAIERATGRLVKVDPATGRIVPNPVGFGIWALLYPTEIGCSSFDCNNNVIPDDEEQNTSCH